MRHKYKGRKLGTSYSHTKAMKTSLVQALFLNDRIKTTETRAKEIRGNVDKIITWAKKGDLHSRRLAIAALGNDSELVREIFEKVSQGMFKDRNGGYTRIMKLGPRKGDGAPMVIMELVTETCVPKAKKSTSKPAAAPKKKATPKKKDEGKETVLEEIADNIRAEEELGSELIREEGEAELAAEKKEAQEADEAAAEKAANKEAKDEDAEEAVEKEEKEDKKAKAKEAEEIREEEFKAEEERAKNAEAEAGKPQEMPESEEHAK